MVKRQNGENVVKNNGKKRKQNGSGKEGKMKILHHCGYLKPTDNIKSISL